MIYNKKYQINIDDSVLEQLHQYRQVNGPETGGILLGYILPDNIIKVKKCSVPCIYGKPSSYAFERDAEKANQIIKREFVESEGKMVYLGEWHTHPTAIPTPSPIDKKSIKDILKNSCLVSNIVIFIIVGRTLDYRAYFDGVKFYEF